ncbi:MAG: aldose 1-epimerase family protein [Butyrivibrio sp.]|nr:aldose 1-epimerase family protein [Butyrivibrio sp.]
MKTYTLENAQVSLQIAADGAEIKSLRDKNTGFEYMWGADPEFWGRTSPVLFPIVGSLKDKTYNYGGKSYSMGQHGFARDMEFELVSLIGHEIWFGLKATEETLLKFPFRFELEVGYKLEGRSISVMWKVKNTDNKTMYFSIGAHPAFNCSLHGSKLRFDTNENLISGILKDGLVSGEEKMLTLVDNELTLSPEMFDDDALIIENNQAHDITLIDPQGNKLVQVLFDAPLFGIWSPVQKDAPFVCIEPWYGRADAADFGQNLEERVWGNSLEAGHDFECSYKILV